MTDSADTSPADRHETDAALARRVAVEAGQLLMVVRAGAGALADDSARRALGDEADRRANDLILERLREARPDDAVLSEESHDDGVRVDRDRVWIVDPLDGTSEYRTARDEFAVHIALWQRGVLTDGCIVLPDRGLVHTTDDETVRPPALDLDGELRVVVSRSHVPDGYEQVAGTMQQMLGEAGHPEARVSHYRVGSVGAKVDEVMAGRAALYLFSGGLSEWDTAAPFVVAARRGYVIGTVDGDEQPYNQRVPRVRSGYVVHPDLADLVAAAVVGSGI